MNSGKYIRKFVRRSKMTSSQQPKLQNPDQQAHNPFDEPFRPFVFLPSGRGIDARNIDSWVCFGGTTPYVTMKNGGYYSIDHPYATNNDCQQRIRQLMKQTLDWTKANQ